LKKFCSAENVIAFMGLHYADLVAHGVSLQKISFIFIEKYRLSL